MTKVISINGFTRETLQVFGTRDAPEEVVFVGQGSGVPTLDLYKPQRTWLFRHTVPPPRLTWDFWRLISPMHTVGILFSVETAHLE